MKIVTGKMVPASGGITPEPICGLQIDDEIEVVHPNALNYWDDLLLRVKNNEPGAFVEWCEWMDEIEYPIE